MMFGGYEYDPSPYAGDTFYDGDYYLEEESFNDYYADEIEDRVIYALDSGEVAAEQLTLWATQ